MKRNQKMKVLAFSMFAGMVAASAPQVKAADLEKYVNTVSSADQAQIVMSLNSSSTDIKPGDTFTVTLSLDKLPDNGLGVGSISFKLAYDSSKVTAAKITTPVGEFPDVKAGPVGSFLGMGTAAQATVGNLETITVGMAKTSIEAWACPTGDVLTIDFTAKEDVTPGTFDMFMVKSTVDPSGDNTQNVAGFEVSGVKKISDGVFEADNTLPVYLNSNLDQMRATVEATSVSFTDNNPVSLDTVNKKTEALGNKLQIDPTGAQGNTVTWRSSNTNVATVDAQGTVTAVGNGTATITATVDGKSATKTVNVTVSPESVDFNVEQTDLNLDKTTKPTLSLKDKVVITPADARVASLDWSSSDPNVATVDSNGTVTAVGNGQTEITVRYSDELYDTVTVKVTTTVASVALDKKNVVLDVETNQTEDVGYTLNPTDAEVQNVTATSSDPSVATAEIVNGKVRVTAKKYGTATITLTVDGKTDTATVKVTVPLAAINIDKNAVTVYKGDTDTVKVTADPEGSAWESLAASTKSGTGVEATVNEQTGVVTFKGLERGNAVVSVYANNDQTGAYIKDVNVTIKENRVTALTLTSDKDEEEEFLRNQTITLTPKYTTEEPETTHKTTDDTTITWTSSDPEVATVDQNGKVTAVSAGTATITAKMAGTANNIEATYDVEVVEHQLENIIIADEDMKVLANGLQVEPGDVVVIPFTVEPEDTTDTPEEILDTIKAYFDEDAMDVEVTYADGKGEIKITYKKDGNADGIIAVGEIPDEWLDLLKEDLAAYEQYLATGEIPEEWLTDEDGNPLEGEEREEEIAWIKEYFDNFFEWWADEGVFFIRANVAAEENADTSDIPVAATAAVMMISLGGIVITRKVLVK